ncbi:MAG TPA: hypothetical protein VHY83_05620 [Solirubrobacteraceae bacterium]|nr:hypothetical protein [Solirubrobacteraceae bacterium]
MSGVIWRTLTIAVACSGLAGCGGQSRPAAGRPDAGTERIYALCRGAARELLDIVQRVGHQTPSNLLPSLDVAANESVAVDSATLAKVQAVQAAGAVKTYRDTILTNLKRSEAGLSAVRSELRHRQKADQGVPMFRRYLDVAGGCGRVRLRDPTTG